LTEGLPLRCRVRPVDPAVREGAYAELVSLVENKCRVFAGELADIDAAIRR